MKGDLAVTGDAEAVWPQIVADARRGRLQPLYRGAPEPAGALLLAGRRA